MTDEKLSRELAAILGDANRDRRDDSRARDLLDQQIDWRELFNPTDDDAGDWLVEPILARGRGHSLFADAKAGKSFLALYLAAAVATGRPVFDRPATDPLDVIYLDYEMTASDIAERLDSFGYTDPNQLARLHHVLLPDIDALDTATGGRALSDAVEDVDARLVIVDTAGRAVLGAENDADTYRDLYRHTGSHLKRLDCSWLRVDHAGKVGERGQRGSSAKNDDVDVVWRLRGDQYGFHLTATHRRMGWVPKEVGLVRREVDGVIELRTAAVTAPPGSGAIADHLDALGVPLDISVRKARAALRANGIPVSQDVLVGALKLRRDRYAMPP